MRPSRLAVDIALRALGRVYPMAAERARSADPAEHPSVEELLDLVTGGAADRVVGRIRPSLQARLRCDFRVSEEKALELANRRLVFMHIMKTGGTSLGELFASWAPPGRGRSRLYIDDLLLTPPALVARLTVISGHLPYEALGLIPGRFRTATLLRDPVARSISHYSELKRSHPRYADLTFAEFVQNDFYAAASGNYQARQLAHRIGLDEVWSAYSPQVRLSGLQADDKRYPAQSLFDSTPVTVSDSELFDVARQNLADLDYVGITEELDVVAAQVADLLGARLDRVPRLNVSPPFDMSQLSGPVARALHRRTEVDRELHHLARARARYWTARSLPSQ